MYCIDTEVIAFMFNGGSSCGSSIHPIDTKIGRVYLCYNGYEKCIEHWFLAPWVYLCSTSLTGVAWCQDWQNLLFDQPCVSFRVVSSCEPPIPECYTRILDVAALTADVYRKCLKASPVKCYTCNINVVGVWHIVKVAHLTLQESYLARYYNTIGSCFWSWDSQH